MRILKVLIVLISFSDPCFGQTGLDVKLKYETKDIITITIIDSTFFHTDIEDSSPNIMTLTFKADSLINLDFSYAVSGFVKIPTEKRKIEKSAGFEINDSEILINVNYFDSYYGKEINYLINGRLVPSSISKIKSVVLRGGNLVQYGNDVDIYQITKNKVVKKSFYIG